EAAAPAGPDDDEVDGGGELGEQGRRVAVQGVLADPHVPAGDGLLDGDAEADLDVGEHVVAVHGCGQPGQRAGAAADRDGGDRGEVGVPQNRLVHGTAQGDRRRLRAVDADDD